jgi:hypothetical protein
MNKNVNEITDGSGMQQKTLTNCPSSPATQGRSLREFEEQISQLRKENFNLKLRIYFLEEKPTASNLLTKSSSLSNSCMNMNTIESISKQNIDLKVTISRFISFNALFTLMFTFMLLPLFLFVFVIIILTNK